MRTFNALRRLKGDPTVLIVQPIANWTLPSGYAYDPKRDRIYNSGTNTTLSDYDQYWETDEVDYLPMESEELNTMIMAGIVKEGSVAARILPADYTKLSVGFRAIIDGVQYNIKGVTKFPAGAATAYAYDCRFERRE